MPEYAAADGDPTKGPATPHEDWVRLRLDLAYDGTAFSGWARQPELRTVAGVLGDALDILFRRQVPLVVAGRTDAGVHADGQVAHIDVPRNGLHALIPRASRVAARTGASEVGASGARTADPLTVAASDPAGDAMPLDDLRGIEGLLRRLSGMLPADVRVRRVAPAPVGFDARFSALRRHYRYRIAGAPYGVSPLRRFDTLALPRPLDLDRMAAAAASLVGLHDFAAYCKPRPGATTVRELQGLSVIPLAEPDRVLAIDVTADAFCHSMVRALVGSLIAVGQGRDPVGRPAELLAARSRSSAINVAPARGLTLMGVDYPRAEALAARAHETRTRREPLDPAAGAADPRP